MNPVHVTPMLLPVDPFQYYLLIFTWVFQIVSFPQASSRKLCIHLSHPPHLLHARPSHSSPFNHSNNIWGGAQIIKLLIMYFSPLLHISSLLGQNILLAILFSNTISLRSLLNVSDQVLYPYKQQPNYSSLYLNLYIF